MIARIWRTRIDEARADEYLEFARSRSLPMFRTQQGFVGVLFARQRAERTVISLWRDLASAHALDGSPTYMATVAEIEATGFIIGPSTIDVLEVEQILLDPAALSPAERGAG
jgi:heme-degrading monooxygenase HmoA